MLKTGIFHEPITLIGKHKFQMFLFIKVVTQLDPYFLEGSILSVSISY